MPTEADARIVIDRLLRGAGWDIENKAIVATEEPTADGRADYLLKNRRTQPLAVVESKRFSVDPYSAKQQGEGFEYHVLTFGLGHEHPPAWASWSGRCTCGHWAIRRYSADRASPSGNRKIYSASV